MISRKISFGVIAGGVSIAASSLSGLIIYPLLLKSLSKEIAGLWFFYTSLSVIISIGHTGLAPIITRRTSAVIENGQPNVISNFIALVVETFKLITIVISILCGIIYFSYLHFILIKSDELLFQGVVAWIFFVLGNLITIYYSKNYYLINGFGEVGWDKINHVIVTALTIFGYFIVLNIGLGLISLSFIFFISSMVYAYNSKRLLKRLLPKDLTLTKGVASKDEIKQILKESSQIIILNLVGILIVNKDIFIVEHFFGLSSVPSYSALIRIQGVITAVSLLIPQMIFPFISKNYNQKNYFIVKRLYVIGVLLALIIGILISSVLFLNAKDIFSLWIGISNYMGNRVLLLSLVLGLIVIHHNAHATSVLATGKNSFVWPAIINGVLSIPFAYVGIQYYGIEGMIWGNLIATFFPSIYVVGSSVRIFNTLSLTK